MEETIHAVFARFRVRAATLAVYDPDYDQDDHAGGHNRSRQKTLGAQIMSSAGSGPTPLMRIVSRHANLLLVRHPS
jgi:hypothetical protein